MRRGLVAILAVLAAPLLAQERATVNVNLIEVPVTVATRDGEPVRGLTAANFALFEDGKQQPIASFDTIDFASKNAPATAIAPMNPAARRAFMLLFDLGYSSPAALLRAQQAARKFVAESVRPRDLVAVATIGPEKFAVLASFTTDRGLVAAAIDKPESFRGNDPLQLTNVTRTFEPTHGDSFDNPDKTADTHRANNMRLADERQQWQAGEIGHANEAYVRSRIERQIDTLGLLAQALGTVPGRKQVVLLSEGFDPKYVRGRDVRDIQGTEKDIVSLEKGQWWDVDSDARFGNTGSMKFLRDMAQRFRASDVVLHAIDIQGVRVVNDVESGTKFNSNDALYLLTRPTGGEVFDDSNKLGDAFSRMLHRQEVVYVLAFYAHGAKPGKMHDLSVKLVNVPNASASYRPAYAEAAALSETERTLTNAEIIVNDVPQNGIAMHAVSGAFVGSGDEAQVPVVLEMKGDDLLKDAAGGSPSFDLYVYAFDSAGEVRDRIYQQLTIDRAKVGDKLAKRGVKYFGVLSLPPGVYAVKSLVKMTNGDRRGYARADVVVPKAGELAVSPYFIDDAPSEWVTVRGASHDRKSSYPFVIGGRMVIPSTTARDAAGEPRTLAVVVRNASADDGVTVETNPKMSIIKRVVSGDDMQFTMRFDGVPAERVIELSVKKPTMAAVTTALPIE